MIDGFWASKDVKARKAHKCCWCVEPIAPGETYEQVSGVQEGSPFRFRWHLDCKQAQAVAIQLCECEGGEDCCPTCQSSGFHRPRAMICDDNDHAMLTIEQARARANARDEFRHQQLLAMRDKGPSNALPT